jgi:putative SOS response-associated peptidase YedK
VCGRFVQAGSAELLAAQFAARDTTDGALRPRYNVAPSTPVPAVLDAGERRLGMLRWGFVPSWARSPDVGPRPINARAEGAASSRLFGPALARRRCIVPMDGWYEWTDEGGARQPWLLRPRSGAPVAVAALWSVWRAADAPADTAPLGTVALMTTEAHGAAADVHHRMPLLVTDALLDAWLDPALSADAALLAALSTAEVDVEVVRVSRRVNDVRNDGPELVEPVLDAAEGA